MIYGRKRIGTMSDHDCNAAARADAKNCAGQSRLAVAVEVRVWFVQNDEKRIPIEGARKSDPLALPRGKLGAGVANARLVTLREPNDELVNARRPCGIDDRLRIGILFKAADILRDRAVEQLDFLRQISDMLAQVLR